MSTNPAKITISLTGRRPVSIVDEEWPLIASAEDDSFSGSDYGRHFQARRQGELDVYILRVRQHADGRAIVSGVYSPRIGRGSEYKEGGELLPSGADIPAAIERVGRAAGIPERVIQACISDLPAEEI